MIKTLMGSIRDYMKVTVATPLLVLGRGALRDADSIYHRQPNRRHQRRCHRSRDASHRGFFGAHRAYVACFCAAAGITCSHASCGFAKNLRHDLFYKIQTFSFANIDEFSSSSLVTRLTTDINNVQQAFMMIIRIAVRAPLVLIFAFTMAFYHGRQRRHGLPGHHSAAGLWTVLYHL